MNSRILLYAGIMLLGVFICAISQVMLKKAAQKEYDNPIQEYLNPLVIIAYAIFFGTTLVDMLAYKVLPLSMGPILEATSYIYVTIFGVTIFKENVNKKKIIALGVIIFGIVVYSVFGV